MAEDFAELLKKACMGDDEALEKILGYFYDQRLSFSEQEQCHFYLKQIGGKNHYAVYLRGLLYKNGYGVIRDLDMSFLLMREAASKGNAKATYEVGLHYLEGLGVETNYPNALQWLQIAANSPHYINDAMYALAKMYETGLGVEINLEKAQEWFKKAKQKTR